MPNDKTSTPGLLPAIAMGTADFLLALWPFVTRGYLNIWTLPDKKTRNFALAGGFDPVDQAVKALSQAGQAVYLQMGLQPTQTGPHSRGKAETTSAIPGLWFDLDIAGPGHKEQALPPDLYAALDLLSSLPLKPTIIVHSGGGIYPFWLFKKPWEFSSDTDRDVAMRLSADWQGVVNKAGRARGFRLDSTGNLDRLLRIPGSVNLKIPSDPRPVRVIYHDPAARHDPVEIEDLLLSLKPEESEIPATTKSPLPFPADADYPPADFDKIMNGCAWLRHCRDDAANLGQPEWYGAISIVARCVDGNQHVHALSKPYPGYNTGETDKKIADSLKNAGPRTCENIRKALGGEPFCAACPNWGKVKSPIVLGHPNGQAMVPEILEELLPDAPIPAGIVTPAGYRITMEKGVVRLEEVKDKVIEVTVCSVPVLLASRSTDVLTETEFVTVVWFRDESWKAKLLPRRVVADIREIMKLCDFGLPVTTITAKALVGYFLDLEVANLRTIPLARSSSHLGWQDDVGFLWGETLLTLKAISTATTNVSFRAQDAGDAQLATALHASGDETAWSCAINSLYAFSRVIITVLASLSSPFVRVLNAANIIVDLAGETSKGKTISQRVAASAWGNPDERGSGSVLNSWFTTERWFDRASTLFNGIPVILDDTKTAKSPEVISSMIYLFMSGKGKSCATLEGLRKVGTWKSIMISSGEQSAVDYAKGHGGAKARVLSLWGAPFGEGDHFSFVQELNMTVKANYGHAGPKVVQFILDHEEDWPLWRTAHREMLSLYAEKTGGVGGVATRLSEIFAFLATTIPLIHAALPELKPSRPIADILDELWPSVMQGALQADLATEALKALWSWAVSNQAKFCGRHKLDAQGSPVEPHQGWAGRWDKPPKWDFLAVTRGTLDAVLGKDFEVAAMIKTWADRGWLLRDTRGKGLQKTVKIGGAATGAYVFMKPTLAKVLELDLDDIDKRLGDDPLLS